MKRMFTEALVYNKLIANLPISGVKFSEHLIKGFKSYSRCKFKL